MPLTDPRVVLRLTPAGESYVRLRSKGIIILSDVVDEDTCRIFCEDMMYLYSVNNFDGTVWVILNSVGGNVYQGLGIYDTINAYVRSGKKINVLGLGIVASMAAVIMQAGSKRLAMPSAQFLLHQVSETTVFKTEEATQSVERAAEMTRLNRIVMGIIAERSGMDLEEFLRLVSKTDFWLDAGNAERFGRDGLIDEVVEKWPF